MGGSRMLEGSWSVVSRLAENTHLGNASRTGSVYWGEQRLFKPLGGDRTSLAGARALRVPCLCKKEFQVLLDMTL